MAAVCNFSNLLTLIIFNGFSLQANRRGKMFLLRSVPTLRQDCRPFPGRDCKFLISQLLVQDNHSGGNYFLIYEINEMLN